MRNSGFQAVENDPENDPQNDAQKGPGSPKRVLPYFLIQTLKRKRPKNDPRENEENTLSECWISPKRLKSIIRYENAVKRQENQV